jgi:F0F1-type ATP synthase membrane subunit c/vacuolar-type H+-ATPase subunit K
VIASVTHVLVGAGLAVGCGALGSGLFFGITVSKLFMQGLGDCQCDSRARRRRAGSGLRGTGSWPVFWNYSVKIVCARAP